MNYECNNSFDELWLFLYQKLICKVWWELHTLEPPQTVNIMVCGDWVWGDYYSFPSLASRTDGSICVFYWKSSQCFFLPWIPPRAASPLEQYRTTFCWLVFWHRPETPTLLYCNLLKLAFRHIFAIQLYWRKLTVFFSLSFDIPRGEGPRKVEEERRSHFWFLQSSFPYWAGAGGQRGRFKTERELLASPLLILPSCNVTTGCWLAETGERREERREERGGSHNKLFIVIAANPALAFFCLWNGYR